MLQFAPLGVLTQRIIINAQNLQLQSCKYCCHELKEQFISARREVFLCLCQTFNINSNQLCKTGQICVWRQNRVVTLAAAEVPRHNDWNWPAFLFKHTEFLRRPAAGAQPNGSLLKNNTALTQSAGLTIGCFFTYRGCWTHPDLVCLQVWTEYFELRIWALNKSLSVSMDAHNHHLPTNCLCFFGRRDLLLGFIPLSDFPFAFSWWIMLLEQQGDSPIIKRHTWGFCVLVIAKVKDSTLKSR